MASSKDKPKVGLRNSPSLISASPLFPRFQLIPVAPGPSLGAKKPPFSSLALKGCPTSHADLNPAYGQDFSPKSTDCIHGCGSLALQESPIMAGDRVSIGFYPDLPQVCWRKRPAPRPSQLSSLWAAKFFGHAGQESALTFRYPKLLHQNDAIRLIEVYPPDGSGMISATIVDTVLSESPFYHALSYEWGPAGREEEILLNGRPIKIRKNLHGFLSIWCVDDVRMLWVDALCIDQNDVKERNRQVAMMGDIYKTATSVILWLGQKSNDSGPLL
jgi:hypothetical protein